MGETISLSEVFERERDVTFRLIVELMDVYDENAYCITHKYWDLKDDETELNQIRLWLETKVNLPQYLGIFIQHGIDTIEKIKLLTMNKVKEIGVLNVNHQIQILHEIERI